jgi:L-aminopeptidase/D-esterase-like protein
MRFLEERAAGFDTRVARVPIVPAAVLFDLGVGDPAARPGASEGYRACMEAGEGVAEGNVGAGTGATVAKLQGIDRALKGGLGTASRQEGELIVGTLSAVNALGEVLDENGEVLAGARPGEESEGRPEATGDASIWPTAPTNTTLVVVATNAKLSKERANLLARAAHDGISGAIRPAHTMWDGDAVFTLATGEVEADQRSLEELVTSAVMEAIRRGVLLAESVRNFPSVHEGMQP